MPHSGTRREPSDRRKFVDDGVPALEIPFAVLEQPREKELQGDDVGLEDVDEYDFLRGRGVEVREVGVRVGGRDASLEMVFHVFRGRHYVVLIPYCPL